MWLENDIYYEDLQYVNNCKFINYALLNNKTVLISGATGMIGYFLVSSLIFASHTFQLNISFLLLVRDIEIAKNKYTQQLINEQSINFLTYDDIENHNSIKCDYIIHAASPTSSKFIVNFPVDVINFMYTSTFKLLKLAKHNNAKFLYISSMETYGQIKHSELLHENSECVLDMSNPRNSYPEGKRICEMLCTSFSQQFNVETNSLRLAQTIGPYDFNEFDTRCFVDFSRKVFNNQDIIINSDGKSKRCFLYLRDAVTAILLVLLNGESPAIYNVANPETFCSVLDMAKTIINVYSSIKPCDSHIVVQNKDNTIFPLKSNWNLSIDRISKLGWSYSADLEQMFKRMFCANCFN